MIFCLCHFAETICNNWTNQKQSADSSCLILLFVFFIFAQTSTMVNKKQSTEISCCNILVFLMFFILCVLKPPLWPTKFHLQKASDWLLFSSLLLKPASFTKPNLQESCVCCVFSFFFSFASLHRMRLLYVSCLCVSLGRTYFDLQHRRHRDGSSDREVYLGAAQYRLPSGYPQHYPHATFVSAYCRAAQAGRKHGPVTHHGPSHFDRPAPPPANITPPSQTISPL